MKQVFPSEQFFDYWQPSYRTIPGCSFGRCEECMVYSKPDLRTADWYSYHSGPHWMYDGKLILRPKTCSNCKQPRKFTGESYQTEMGLWPAETQARVDSVYGGMMNLLSIFSEKSDDGRFSECDRNCMDIRDAYLVYEKIPEGFAPTGFFKNDKIGMKGIRHFGYSCGEFTHMLNSLMVDCDESLFNKMRWLVSDYV